MRPRLLLVLPLIAAFQAPAQAGTEVIFVAPERYSDADGTGARSRAEVLAEIGGEFRRLGSRLPAGQDLTVEVLDVDLAGEVEPFRRFSSDVRIVRDTMPPQIRLRYALRERGRVVASGEERLSGVNFQWRSTSLVNSDPLRYEKTLLADWFAKRFPRRG